MIMKRATKFYLPAFWKLRGGLWHNVIVAKTDTNSDLFTELYSSVDKVTKEFLPKLAT